jgi:hypothetical protein
MKVNRARQKVETKQLTELYCGDCFIFLETDQNVYMLVDVPGAGSENSLEQFTYEYAVNIETGKVKAFRYNKDVIPIKIEATVCHKI